MQLESGSFLQQSWQPERMKIFCKTYTRISSEAPAGHSTRASNRQCSCGPWQERRCDTAPAIPQVSAAMTAAPGRAPCPWCSPAAAGAVRPGGGAAAPGPKSAYRSDVCVPTGTQALLGKGCTLESGDEHSPQTWSPADCENSGWLRHGSKQTRALGMVREGRYTRRLLPSSQRAASLLL